MTTSGERSDGSTGVVCETVHRENKSGTDLCRQIPMSVPD